MSKRICILTGASRGLGLAMARQLRAQGCRLLTLARQPNPELDGPGVEQWAVDLSVPAAVAARLRTWVAAVPRAEVASLTLINNAAGLARLAPLGDVEADDLSAAIRVGLEAPMLLARAIVPGMLARNRGHVVNISSGAGKVGVAYGTSYCPI